MALSADAPLEFIRPAWGVSPHVRACVTTRAGGVSRGARIGLNLAAHVGDDAELVEENRARLAAALDLPGTPRWLTQVHGTDIVHADNILAPVAADAAWTRTPGVVCAVLTADCLPVLLADRAGTMVAAVHAGWRGLAAGILARGIDRFVQAGIVPADIFAWLGPAISAHNYEVDAQVRDAFVGRDAGFATSFALTRAGHWQFDLYAAARRILSSLGVTDVSGGEYCTHADRRLFSFRRDRDCGRQAALIWIAAPS